MPVDAIGVAARVMTDDLFRLNVVSQNLANAGSAGFKRERVAARPFLEELQAGTLRVPVSLPVLTSVPDLRQGTLTQTGSPLDVAIEGEGFFELAAPEGPLYTRQGSFTLDAEGRLVTPAGMPVSGLNGEIVLTGPAPRIDRQGRVFEGERLAGQLKIMRFAERAPLTALGAGLYRAAGAGDVLTDALQVRQGFLESSNVQSLPEMVSLIELVRRFESAQKVVQSYDGMLDNAIRTLGEF